MVWPEADILALAAAVAAFAGFVKGLVGFGLPMLMFSGLGMFLPIETALAVLILPTLLTNGAQALREGWRAAWRTICRFRIFLSVGFVFLLVGAQLVAALPERLLFLTIGGAVTVFALLLLVRPRFRVPEGRRAPAEVLAAAIAGVVGGMSGVWGPPTVAYLTAMNTPKQDQVRAQGVIYGLGAVALLGAHMRTGIVSGATVPISLALLAPALCGMWLGMRVQNRADQSVFRKLTLVVLVLAGLNLIRRGWAG